MKREQIMKIFRDYSVTHGDLMSVADAILALPLDVPSDEEIMQKYPFWDEIDLVSNLDNQEGAKWMKEEIIKRNN